VFVLLNHLRRLRHEIAAPAPPRRGSLALRHVDAGSCNGCEHELTAACNPYYDLSQYGLNIVASPRHADILLVTGAVTTRMHAVLRATYDAMPEPRLVAALGNCALGEHLLGDPDEFAPPLDTILPVALRVPGCPPHPAAIAAALLDALDQLPSSRARAGAPAPHGTGT
jgi:Ni,Fe-hydrogenase III small subunit